ncbi:MAG: YjjG family noncanonical pyrimidine nucleotidase [Aristaeellaceae bacterium]
MRYKYLLVDNDNTLMDFTAAEHHALRAALTARGLPPDDAICSLYSRINDSLWKALERGETTQKALKVERFRRLLAQLGRAELDAEATASLYEQYLSTRADLLPGAVELLTAVHGQMKIALVSNGVSVIQRGRLSRCPFTPLLDAVIISEEIGISKPDPAMVFAALDALGCQDKSEAILLGDSLTADIAAATRAGIDSIHLNPKSPPSLLPTYTVTTLSEAQQLLCPGSASRCALRAP